MKIVRVAVVQDRPVVFNRKATLEKVHSLVNRAAGEGAKLVVLPEAFVSAYPTGLDFGARIGLRTPEGREDFRRYYVKVLWRCPVQLVRPWERLPVMPGYS